MLLEDELLERKIQLEERQEVVNRMVLDFIHDSHDTVFITPFLRGRLEAIAAGYAELARAKKAHLTAVSG